MERIKGIKVNGCGVKEVGSFFSLYDLVLSLRLSDGGIVDLKGDNAWAEEERCVTVNDETLRIIKRTEYADYDGEKYPVEIVTLRDSNGKEWSGPSVVKALTKYINDKVYQKAKYLKMNNVIFIFTDKSLLDIVNNLIDRM